jgi:hypothetical protein
MVTINNFSGCLMVERMKKNKTFAQGDCVMYKKKLWGVVEVSGGKSWKKTATLLSGNKIINGIPVNALTSPKHLSYCTQMKYRSPAQHYYLVTNLRA